MTLSKETKKKITEQLSKYVNDYAHQDEKERQKNGQFFTPPELVIKMIEKFSHLDGKVLDPCAGSGNLIIGCILAGADPKKCYANELDPAQYAILKKNLTEFGVPEENILNYDALGEELYNHLKGRPKAANFFKTKVS